jgi:hypothetical protein
LTGADESFLCKGYAERQNRQPFISHLQKGKGSVNTKWFHEKRTSTADSEFLQKKKQQMQIQHQMPHKMPCGWGERGRKKM